MLRLLSILLIFFLGTIAPASAQDWVEFKPPGSGYRVEFPEAPKVQVQEVKTTAGRATWEWPPSSASATAFCSLS